jgi:hypothetical protein
MMLHPARQVASRGRIAPGGTYPPVHVARYSALALALLLAACSRSRTEPAPTPVPEQSVRVVGVDQPLRLGDCAEAMRRALEKPDLAVDRIPEPVSRKPDLPKRIPPSVLNKDGSAEIKVDVLVDTLGKADMKTFKVVAASNPWFVRNIQAVIGQWKFTPAQLAGCKVPRVYHFMASVPARATRPAQPAKKPATKPSTTTKPATTTKPPAATKP